MGCQPFGGEAENICSRGTFRLWPKPTRGTQRALKTSGRPRIVRNLQKRQVLGHIRRSAAVLSSSSAGPLVPQIMSARHLAPGSYR